ncbi:MAG: peptidoglycan-binding domain-containing protein [Pseudomonadota bacterium]
MISKTITASAVALSLAVIPATKVSADAGDFVAGAIIGGIVGHAATKNHQRKRATTRTYTKKTYKPRLPSTQEGREIQASLNYFGFNAGTVDGQLGSRSRAAISSYQAYLGYPATGQLTPFEQNLLITSYNRSQAGGYAVNQQIAQNPEGTRGLLKVYRQEMAGGTPVAPVAPGATIVVAPQPVAPVGTTTTTTVVATPTAPVAVEPAAPEVTTASTALPNFLGDGGGQSLASHCNTVSLLTNTNGGFTTQASMTDPNVALNEQFCLARTYAIAKSEDMIAKVQGFTPDQIAAQCQQFGPAMQPHLAALALKSQPEVVSDVAGFILTTGMSPAQLKGTAQICMGVGYRTDDMDVALGSALMLFAMGDHVYGELMGHHLAQGFGTSKRVDVARVWYAEGLKAVDAGAPAVFAPGQPERVELLRKASLTLGTNSSAVATQPQVQPASALPSFGVVISD